MSRMSGLERVWLWGCRRPLLAGLSLALATAVILGLAGILWEWRQAELHAQGEERQRLIAEQDAAETRLNLYAADVAVAAQAIQNGHPGAARRTLAALRPVPGFPDLRGFEWYYLWHLSAGDQLAVLKGHQLTVACAAFSPEGRWLATGSHDGTVRIWNAEERTFVRSLKITPGAVWSVAFMPDGRHLLAGGNDNVQIWDTTKWERTAQYPGELAALAAAGNLLATAESSPFAWEPAGPVRLFNWQTGQLLGTLDQPGRAVALTADGRFLAVTGSNSGIRIYDTATRQIRQAWSTPEAVWGLSFSPDGRRLLSTSWTTNTLVWTLDQPGPPEVLSGHLLHVWSAVWSADGTTIATTSSDQTVRLWDAATLAPRAVLHGQASEVWCAAFRPDGRLLATGGKDQNVLLWPTTPPPSLQPVPHDQDYRPIFSPDGRWLLTLKPRTGGGMLWRTDDLSLVNSNLAAGGNLIAGFNRDGKSVITFNQERGSLQFRRPADGVAEKEIALAGLGAPSSKFADAGLSPAGEYFFAIDAAGLIRIWNTDTGRLWESLPGPLPPIRNAVLGPQGRQIAVSVARENAARLYDCATGTERNLTGHRDFISGLAFSPDGLTLATGSMDGTIRLWNTAAGTVLATLPGHLQETTDVAFSPDGQTLASLAKNESLKLWHLPTLRELYSENDPHAGLWLRFSPDGRQLAVVTDQDQVRLLAAPPD